MMGSYIGKKGTWTCDWPECTRDSDRKFKVDMGKWYAGMAFCHYHLERIHLGFTPASDPLQIQGERRLDRERMDRETMYLLTDRVPRKRISFTVAWYDFWIGLYYDRTKKRLYFLPLPCVGVCIQL